jgi:polyhydroxyalkanoate synthesis regulator phasin
MDEARATLDALRTQIRKANAEFEKDQSMLLRTEEQTLRSELSSIEAEIDVLKDSVATLHETESRTQAKVQSRTAEVSRGALQPGIRVPGTV